MAEKKAISRRTLIDGSVFIVISLICMVEAYRLYNSASAFALAQDLFPGLYIFLLGAVLLVAGIVYLAGQLYVADEQAAAQPEASDTQVGPLLILGILIGYSLFIGILGYATATFLFFFVAFRLFRVRSWWLNFALSLSIAALFHFLFVKYLAIIFPRGILI